MGGVVSTVGIYAMRYPPRGPDITVNTSAPIHAEIIFPPNPRKKKRSSAVYLSDAFRLFEPKLLFIHHRMAM